MKKISSRTYKIGGGIAVVLLALFAILARSKSDNASAAETTKTETMVVGPENITVATTGSIMAGPSISGAGAGLRFGRRIDCKVTLFQLRASLPADFVRCRLAGAAAVFVADMP